MAQIGSLCVYCGSSNKVATSLFEAAFDLGRQVGRAGINLVYGGGRVGLMGRVADGVLVEGGHVTGIIPRHLNDREIVHPAVQELIVVESMHERKRLMAERSDAFAVLPGGYGTLDEMFEILTWRQLGLHDKPILLVDIDHYWAPLHRLLEHLVASGFVWSGDANWLTNVDGINGVLPALDAAVAGTLPVQSPKL